MRRRRGIMGLNGGAGIPVITATASGNPLSFVTDMVRPLKSLVIPFTPIQSGSGDPSPTNVRPISGWNATTINHTGANLLNGTTAANILKTGKPSQVSLGEDEDGKYVRLIGMSGADVNLTKTLKFKENTRYTVILTGKNESSGVSSTHIRFVYSDGNSTEIYWSAPTEIKTIAVASAANKTVKAITTLTRNYNTRIYYEKPFGLFEGVVSASSFEEYQGQSIPVSFTDPTTGDPLTIYGGTLTLNEDGSVDLVREYGMKPISDWKYYMIRTQNPTSGWDSFQLYLPSDDIKQAGGSVVDGKPNIWSTIFQARTNAEIADNPGYSIRKAVVYIYLAVPADTYTSWNDFKTAFGDIPIVYPLATPQTYHFDNVGQLKSFIGQNNVWTDTNGTNTATYLKHQS